MIDRKKMMGIFSDLNDTVSNLFHFAWRTAVFIGFLILSTYFITIGFVPVADFTSLLYVLIIVAMIGSYILLFIGFAFVLAPIYWMELLKMPDVCQFITGSDNACKLAKSYSHGHIDTTPKESRRISFFYFLFVSLYVFPIWLSDYYHQFYLKKLIIIFGVLSYLGSKIVFVLHKESDLEYTPLKKSFFSKYFNLGWILLRLIMFSAVAGIILYIGNIFIILLIDAKVNPLASTLSNTTSFSFIVIVASSLCLIPPNDKWNIKKWMITVSVFAIIYIFITLGIFGASSSLVVRALKLGAIKETSLTVDKIGCQILRLNGVSVTCQGDTLYSISNIDILWRVGEYYIRFNTKAGKEKTLMLPSKHVLAISASSNSNVGV